MKKALSYCVIIIGAFLEIFYIVARYKPDGIIAPICILIGIALNIFLMLAAYNNNKPLMLALVCFSILNTSAGQTLSLKKTEVKSVSNIGIDETVEQNKRYAADIAKLDTEIDAINRRLNGFETMEEKAEYRNNVAADEQTIEKKRAEKARLEKLISDNTKDKKKEVEKTVQAESVYTFYGSMNTWKPADWLTFVLHTIFSVFISIMAPYGIYTLEKIGQKKTRTRKPREEKSESAITESFEDTTDEEYRRFAEYPDGSVKMPEQTSRYLRITLEEAEAIHAKLYAGYIYRDGKYVKIGGGK